MAEFKRIPPEVNDAIKKDYYYSPMTVKQIATKHNVCLRHIYDIINADTEHTRVLARKVRKLYEYESEIDSLRHQVKTLQKTLSIIENLINDVNEN